MNYFTESVDYYLASAHQPTVEQSLHEGRSDGQVVKRSVICSTLRAASRLEMLHAIMHPSCTAAHRSTLPGLPTATQQQSVSVKSKNSSSEARGELVACSSLCVNERTASAYWVISECPAADICRSKFCRRPAGVSKMCQATVVDGVPVCSHSYLLKVPQ